MSYKKGFTVIELLVVISIISMLASVVLVAVNGARDKGKVAAGQTFYSHTYTAFGADAYAMYTFDNQDGADSSGNANTLTLTGNPTWATGSQTVNNRGAAIILDSSGSGQYGQSNKPFTVPNPGSTIDITMGAWIKTSGNSSKRQTIVELFDSGQGTYFSFCLGESGQLRYMQTGWKNGGSEYCLSNFGSARVIDDKWHYVAMSFDRNYLRSFYVDGKLDFSVNEGPSGTNKWNFNVPINVLNIDVGYTTIGGVTPPDMKFNGTLDEVSVYSHSLTAQQIKDIYLSGLPRHQLAKE